MVVGQTPLFSEDPIGNCSDHIPKNLFVPPVTAVASFEDLLGINSQRNYRSTHLGPFSFVRYFHQWILDEGTWTAGTPAGEASPPYPNQSIR